MIRMALLDYPFVLCALSALLLFVGAFLTILIVSIVKSSGEALRQGALLPLQEEE